MADGKKIVKSASAKTAAKTSRKNSEKEVLAKELKGLISRLDEEGLSFLIEQAQVHLYNMQVDELNKTLVKSAERTSRNTGKAAAGKAVSGGFTEIKASESGSSYYIVYKNEWIMFTREEMTHLAAIAGAEGSDLEIRERLYNWLARERSDVLKSAAVPDKFDPKLKTLVALLKKSFKVRH